MLKKLAPFTLLASCSISLVQAIPSASLEKRVPKHRVKPDDLFYCGEATYRGEYAITASNQARAALKDAAMITDDKLPEDGYPKEVKGPEYTSNSNSRKYYIHPINQPNLPEVFALIDSSYNVVDVVYYNFGGLLWSCPRYY